MRPKGFLIAVVVFTVLYILICKIIDKAIDKNKDSDRLLKQEIDLNKFYNFAKFYGVQTTINENHILSIYNFLKDTDNIRISYIASQTYTTPPEVIVTLLYLEYLNYLSEKAIHAEQDLIMDFNLNDKALFDKYIGLLREKKDYQTIEQMCGQKTYEDLFYIDKYFLIEGIRFYNKRLYYAGDYNV